MEEILNKISVETRRLKCKCCGMNCAESEAPICTILIEHGLVDICEYVEAMMQLTAGTSSSVIEETLPLSP